MKNEPEEAKFAFQTDTVILYCKSI